MSEQESALHTYHVFVIIDMLQFEVQRNRAPNKDTVLEQFAQDIIDGKLDDKIFVYIEPEPKER